MKIRMWIIAFLLVANLIAPICFGGTASLNYDTLNHKVIKPPSSPSAPHDLDFTGLDVFGLPVTGGGGGTPGGADRQLQFNNAFTFGGIPYATYDGTTVTFRTGARFTLADPTDATKRVQFALANPTATLKTVTIADNSVTVLPSTAATNNFITGVNASGILLAAQPSFSNLSGTLALAQTSMGTGKLIGRYSASTGAMQEITLGTNLTLNGSTGVLDAAGGAGTPGGNDFELQWNDGGAAFNGVSSLTTDGVNNVFATATRFFFSDPIDPTKLVHIDASPLSGGAIVYIKVPSNSWTVAPDSAVANQFLTAITNGIPLHAQPAFSNLSGVPSLAQQNIPIGKERFVDPTNGVNGTGAANLARPYLTIASAFAASSAGDVVYLYPNTTGYDQGTTPLVIPAGVTVVGAGPDTTVITGAVTKASNRALVEPGTASAIYNVTITNTASSGIPFGVGSSSAAFTSAYLGGSKLIGVSDGISLAKAGTTGLVVENTSVGTQGDDFVQSVATALTEFRNCDFTADGTTNAVESKGLNVTNGTVRFNYGSITVGNSVGTNVGAFGSGSGSTIELHGVRINNTGGGSSNYDVQQASSATVGVEGTYRPDAAALVTNGTVSELSRYAVRDAGLLDYPNLGSATRGDVIYFNGTAWVKLAAGIDGNVLTTHGSTADPEWLAGAGAGGATDDTVFGSSWDGATTTSPSQNSVYDYLHSFVPNDDGKVNLLNQAAGIPYTNASGVLQTPLVAPPSVLSGGAIVGTTDVQKLTNKRIKKRRLSVATPGPTPAINTDDYDVVNFSVMDADLTINSTTLTGAPDPADTLHMIFTDDGTARALNFSTLKFMASPGQALPTTTTASTRLDVLFTWDNINGRWRCLASSNPVAVSGAGTVTSVGITGSNGISSAGGPITSAGSITLSLPITLAGTTGKTFTVNNNLTLNGTDGSTLDVGAGGTLGTNAFNSTAFLTSSSISDTVFGATWDTVTAIAPSKNAIYDWAHTFDTDDDGKVNVLDIGAGIPKTDASGIVSVATAGTDYADLAFRTLAVSGQSNVVADSASDTLTLVAGTGMTITTTPGTDTVTFTSTGGAGSVPTGTGFYHVTSGVMDSAALAPTTLAGYGITDAQPLDADLTAIAALTATTGNFMVANGSAWASRTPNEVRTTLALQIGTNVEAWDADLDTWAGKTPYAGTLTITTGKTFDVTGNLTLSGTDGSTLAIGTGGTLGTAAYTAATAYQAADSDLTTWAGITPGTGVGTALAVNVGTAGAIVVNGGALGTPSGGTLTNATGLPIAGLTASTSTALGVGSIELGHASDTSLTRAAAGVLAVEGNRVNNDNPRVHAVASVSTTWTPDFDTYQQEALTALAGDINVAAPTATGAADGQKRILRIKADTTLRNLTWDSIYIPMVAALPLTVAASKTVYAGIIYNGNTSKWDVTALVVQP